MTMSKPLRPSPLSLVIATIAIAMVALLLALGTWQLQRRVWKLQLMEHIAQRVHAQATPAPGPRDWPGISAADSAYRHISAEGVWMEAQSTWVQAVTELGSGYWLLSPLRLIDGTILFVNRGFVPTAQRPAFEAQLARAIHAPEPVSVSGLLRISEPGGAFLRHNDAQAKRWYSRDVQAMAVAGGLSGVAPYFMDAQSPHAAASATAQAGLQPVAGLTVIDFQNNHLVYALTWYALALMVAWAGWRTLHEGRPPHDNRGMPNLNHDPAHAR